METVSVKFNEDVLKKIDRSISEHNFTSRTEFIRSAVRDKLADLNREELIKEFLRYKGRSKNKTTEEDNRKTREAASKELMEELEKRFR